MDITFSINEEELFIFNQYLFDHSKTVQKAFTKNRSLISFSPVPAAIMLGLANQLSSSNLLLLVGIVAATISLPAYFVYPMFVRKNLRKRIIKMYGEGKNRGIIGDHELKIDSDGLIEITQLGEVRQGWDSIQQIVSHNDRTYIFVSDTNAYILSRKSVVKGDYDAFVAGLLQYKTV